MAFALLYLVLIYGVDVGLGELSAFKSASSTVTITVSSHLVSISVECD